MKEFMFLQNIFEERIASSNLSNYLKGRRQLDFRRSEVYSEPCKIPKMMECFFELKQLKAVNYFHKTLHLKRLAGF